jgi:hypothetical protein
MIATTNGEAAADVVFLLAAISSGELYGRIMVNKRMRTM